MPCSYLWTFAQCGAETVYFFPVFPSTSFWAATFSYISFNGQNFVKGHLCVLEVGNWSAELLLQGSGQPKLDCIVVEVEFPFVCKTLQYITYDL